MSKMEIRPWTLADIPSIQSIMWTSWCETYSGFIPEEDLRAYFDEHMSTEMFVNLCNDETARIFMAAIQETAIGFSKTKFNKSQSRFYVQSLHVLPAYQGKGVGSLLMKQCEMFALSFGVDSLWLGVMEQNAKALEWYKRNGFQFVEQEPFTMGKTTVNHFIGFKNISLQK